MKKIGALFILALTLLSCGNIYVLVKPPVDGTYIIEEKIHSNRVNYDYTIYVCLPESYYQSNKTYPVVYILDGDAYTGDTYKMAKEGSRAGTFEEIILVGIGVGLEKEMNEVQIQRNRDFTPTKTGDLAGYETGGAADFFAFLEQELNPYLESKYRLIGTADTRYIFGHSLGALAAYYGALFHNNTFTKFTAISPAIWWDNTVLLTYEQAYSETNSTLDASIYSSFSTGESVLITHLSLELWQRFASRNYTGFTTKTEVEHYGTHSITWREGFKKGLAYHFSK